MINKIISDTYEYYSDDRSVRVEVLLLLVIRESLSEKQRFELRPMMKKLSRWSYLQFGAQGVL